MWWKICFCQVSSAVGFWWQTDQAVLVVAKYGWWVLAKGLVGLVSCLVEGGAQWAVWWKVCQRNKSQLSGFPPPSCLNPSQNTSTNKLPWSHAQTIINWFCINFLRATWISLIFPPPLGLGGGWTSTTSTCSWVSRKCSIYHRSSDYNANEAELAKWCFAKIALQPLPAHKGQVWRTGMQNKGSWAKVRCPIKIQLENK